MKKLFCPVVLLLLLHFSSQAQFKNILKNVSKKDSSGKSTIQRVFHSKSAPGDLSNDEIVSGLKEALSVGTSNAAQKLSTVDGFFKDAAIKILMPPEAENVEKSLRNMGMGQLVDKTILSMNRAAEDASKQASPIFINAVKQMSIQDAVGILRGGDFAATDYLKSKTNISLTESFRPVIEASLKKVNATRYWNVLFSNYNKFSLNKINPDLSAYVTEKALSGIFFQVAQEEQKIRKNPLARTSDLLKKVFKN
ncbi:MAG: DUF4197 domain-containing protein [Flavisolibacter sp.]